MMLIMLIFHAYDKFWFDYFLSFRLYSNPLNVVDFTSIGKARNLTSLLLDSTGLADISGMSF